MAKTTEEIYRELMEQGQNHQTQANNYLNKYDNRAAFSYDANNDPVYQSLRDQSVHQGKQAMTDTMGQAAGLTGGYASTYGQSVGNQAYNEYLTKLSAQIPGLAASARAAYDAEGDRLLNRYNLELNAAGTAYNQAREALADQRYEQEYADSQAYQQWQQERADRSEAYDRAMVMIQLGRMPDAEALAAAGISAEDAQWLTEYYLQLIANQNSGGSGRYYYSGSDTSGGPNYDNNGGGNIDQITYRGAYQTLMAARQLGDLAKADEMMERAMSNSKLTQSEKQQLFDLYRQLWGIEQETVQAASGSAHQSGNNLTPARGGSKGNRFERA